MSPLQPPCSGRAICKDLRQLNAVRGDISQNDPVAFELALREARIVCRRGRDKTERCIDGQAVTADRAECLQELEQIPGRRKLAGIHLGRKKVVPEIPLAH